MIVRLTGAYLAIFSVVLFALSIGAYALVATEYHSLLLPALSTPEGQATYALELHRLILIIIGLDVPLLVVVGLASAILAHISIRPLMLAREQERSFVADAAHELRSPLATIATVAQAARNGVTDAQLRDSLDLIARTALDAGALIGDLLTLAREPNRALLAPEPIDLAVIAHRCASEFEARAREAGIVLTVETQPAIVDGDERRLREVVRNLLDNALRHARSRIALTCSATESSACLSVVDDGAGISPQERAHIFERFVANRKTGGSGLGLSIARWVAQAHGGTLTVEGRTTNGAAFELAIPLFVD